MPVDSRDVRPTPSRHLTPGAPVSVRSSFEGAWCSGYQIAEVVKDGDGVAGFRLRRMSDGAVLPPVFPLSEVIPAGR
jgi:hypothetical protein